MHSVPTAAVYDATTPARFQFSLADLFCLSTYYCFSAAVGCFFWPLLPLLFLMSVPIFFRMQALHPVDKEKVSFAQRLAGLLISTLLEWSLAFMALFCAVIAAWPIGILIGGISHVVVLAFGETVGHAFFVTLFVFVELTTIVSRYETLRRATWPTKMRWN